MTNLSTAHFASVTGPLWGKNTGGRSRPEEVKFHSPGRNQETFSFEPRIKERKKWDFNIFRKVNLYFSHPTVSAASFCTATSGFVSAPLCTAVNS